MTHQETVFNSVAPLRNVSAFVAMVDRVMTRTVGLDALAVFYGPSGFGKTTAATYAANYFNAWQVQVKSCWTATKLCVAVLDEMGIQPKKRVYDMVDQIAEEMAFTGRPLIIDEADFLVKRRMIEIIRDIHEGSGAPVILIGEELLPQKLQRWERVSGRVLETVAAQPACAEDVEHLARIYCPDVELDPAFREAILKAAKHSIRRVCINLDRVREFARTSGANVIDMNTWGKRAFQPARAPEARRYLA